MSSVQVKQLSKYFGENHVLNNINCDIKSGEFITLLGPSGCGKSTLLRCLAGLTAVDTGHIWVDGQDITETPVQRRGIGMVFQNYALFPNMTVARNIAFGLKMMSIPSRELQARVDEAIAMVELQGKEDFHPHQLSGGQRQRVALARALVVRPRILLLDEPLSALDAIIRRSLRSEIRAIQQKLGLTTIFVTHDQEEALTLSDRIFLMNKGAIVQHGRAEEIYTQPADGFVAGFMGSYNLLSAEQANKLLGLSISGKLAIRPESIYVREMGRQYGEHITAPLKSQVEEHQLLGSVIRYRVRAGDCVLTVDLLNRSSERLFGPGTELELLFNKNEMRELTA